MINTRILIVDDEYSILTALKYVLSNYCVDIFQKATDALDIIKSGKKYDIILSDLMMPDMNGSVFLSEIKKYLTSYKTVLITAYTTEDILETGLNEDLFNRILRKPVDFDCILNVINELITQLEKDRSKDYACIVDRIVSTYGFKKSICVHESKVMDDIITNAMKFAKFNENVCIEGESGVGKEVIASIIHEHSARASEPFVMINCSAITDNLFESELFGYKKGAFTGANCDKPGKFKIANKGTLFLDEIGDMPINQQAKLLRVLEEHEVSPVGSTHNEKIDVRIICATNKNIDDEVKNGTFRADLRHRLNVLNIWIPPLRDRKEDIPLLASYLLAEYINKKGVPTKVFTDEALEFLSAMEFSGNVRELRNLVIKLYVLSGESVITKKDVEKNINPCKNTDFSVREFLSKLNLSLSELETEYILAQLARHDYHVSNTAKNIGCLQSHLSRKISDLGISLKQLKLKKE